MTIDLTIPEHEFFSARWNPDDSVIRLGTNGNFLLFCHHSQRVIAWTNTMEEARVLIYRAQIESIRSHLDSLPDDHPNRTFNLERYAARVPILRGLIVRMGFPDTEDAPEIAGTDERNAETPWAAFLRELLGGRGGATIEFDKNLYEARTTDAEDRAVDLNGLRAFLKRYISNHATPGFDPASMPRSLRLTSRIL